MISESRPTQPPKLTDAECLEAIDDVIRTATTRFDTTDADAVTVQNFYFRLYQLRDALGTRPPQ